jgi:hypothetical protein
MQETLTTETPAEVESYKAEIERYMAEIDVILDRIERNQTATREAAARTRARLGELRRMRTGMETS